MENSEKIALAVIDFAPYMQKATALIGCARRVGGNQFRHQMATLAILVDYHYTDSVVLKTAIIHDLFEDTACPISEIQHIDQEGFAVARLVSELSRKSNETKSEYLTRLKDNGSYRAKIVKVADRISNMTDLNNDCFDRDFMRSYIRETVDYVYPIALEVNKDMAMEIADLVERRKRALAEQPFLRRHSPALFTRKTAAWTSLQITELKRWLQKNCVPRTVEEPADG